MERCPFQSIRFCFKFLQVQECVVRKLSWDSFRRGNPRGNARFGVLSETCSLRRLDGGCTSARTWDPPTALRHKRASFVSANGGSRVRLRSSSPGGQVANPTLRARETSSGRRALHLAYRGEASG